MTAAASRQALASVGRDLLAAAGSPGVKRGAELVTAAPPPARCFRDLGAVPDWLRQPAPILSALGQRVALQSMAMALARSIDGALLGRLAEACGEAALDAAIASAVPGDDQPIVDGDAITMRGTALLAAAAPPALRGYLPTALPADLPADRVQGWIDRAAVPA